MVFGRARSEGRAMPVSAARLRFDRIRHPPKLRQCCRPRRLLGSAFFKSWLARIAPMVEGESTRRQLYGLEAWFRDPAEPMPPRWKMALLTWIAVWPVSILVSTIVASVLGRNVPQVVQAALVAVGLVAILTWVAMPPLVKIAHSWLHPKSSPDGK